MRTTLILNDELVTEAKRRAADRRTSLSAVVNEALRKALHATAESGSATGFSIPTYRPRTGPCLDTPPAELHDLLAAEDSSPYRV